MPHPTLIVDSKHDNARLGRLVTAHGTVATPVFMPVGTQATVKSVLPRDVYETGSGLILSNAYHLYLRPGTEIVRLAGGLHKFMGWPGALLTDSGGFQIMRFGHTVKVDDGGATFRSHIDGRAIRFTPENSVKAQVDLGADIIMCLDECVPYPVTHKAAKDAVRRTSLWARRQREIEIDEHQALFGIVQGSTFEDLRKESALELGDLNFPGYALGGFSVGESKTQFYEIMDYTVRLLPCEKPRYLMGVGHPLDLIRGALLGVDMFDCVLPTRNARHGRAFTFQGALNLRNASHIDDFMPLEEGCDCAACRGFSRAYIRHLLSAGESLAWTLLTVHNLRFFQRFMARLRSAIADGSAENFYSEMERLYPIKEKSA